MHDKDLHELLALFHPKGVEFLVVGGGTGRTQDIADAEFLERIQERDDQRL